MKVLAAASVCLVLAGCATSSAGIATGYSSPLVYAGYTCQQLGFEDQELLSRVSSLGGQIDRRATNDKIAMGVAAVVFWPALFFVKGDGAEAAEYARLKGEHEAVNHAAIMKGCLGGARTGGEVAYAPVQPLQPYQPRPAAVSYSAPPAYPVAGPYRPYGEIERMHAGQAVIDNYGRDERPQ